MNGTQCEDYDECSVNNGGCAQTCTNTEGSYVCSCDGGYKLQNDGHGCEDVNECDGRTASHYCEGACVNTIGGYYCTCPHHQQLRPSQVVVHAMSIPESSCQNFPMNHQESYFNCQNPATNFGMPTCSCRDTAGNSGVVANSGGCLGESTFMNMLPTKNNDNINSS